MNHFISNAAFNSLLKILKYIRNILCGLSNQEVEQFAELFPDNLRSAQKLLGVCADDFEKFVSCKKCSSIYTYQEASYIDRGRCYFQLLLNP